MHSIRWTDITNQCGIRGCSQASPGCQFCYSAAMAHRLGSMASPPLGYRPDMTRLDHDGTAHWSGIVRADSVLLEHDLARLPRRKRKFVFPSMVDPFHESVPFEHIDDALFKFGQRPHLRLQLLTKRA